MGIKNTFTGIFIIHKDTNWLNILESYSPLKLTDAIINSEGKLSFNWQKPQVLKLGEAISSLQWVCAILWFKSLQK